MNQTDDQDSTPPPPAFWQKHQPIVYKLLKRLNAEVLRNAGQIQINMDVGERAALTRPNLALAVPNGSLRGMLGVCLSEDGEGLLVVATNGRHWRRINATLSSDDLVSVLKTVFEWWINNQLPAPEPPQAPTPAPTSPEIATDVGEVVGRGSPFWTIWRYPRATIRYIVDTEPTRYVIGLVLVYGVLSMLTNTFLNEQLMLALPLPVLIGVFGAFGAFGGILGLYVNGLILKQVSDWLTGAASLVELRAVYAWSSVPAIVFVAIFLVMVVMLSAAGALPPDDPALLEPIPSMVTCTAVPALLVVGVWRLVVYVACVAEVCQFSTGRALGMVLLSNLLSIFIFALPLSFIQSTIVAFLLR